MTVELIHAGGRGTQSDTHFGTLAAAIDNLERISGDRIGGPTIEETDDLARLERRLARVRPVTGEDWQWLARRLARAMENGWHGAPANRLLKLAA